MVVTCSTVFSLEIVKALNNNVLHFFTVLPILGIPLCQQPDLFSSFLEGQFGTFGHWQRGLLSKGVDAPKNACVAAYPSP
jgi:hypothetical protein